MAASLFAMLTRRLGWLLGCLAVLAGGMALAAVLAGSSSPDEERLDGGRSNAERSGPERPNGERPGQERRAEGALPRMHLSVDRRIPNEPKVDGELRMPGYRGELGIEIRGNLSLRWPKKSFAIELDSPGDGDRDAPLLGMPEDGDWVLYAPYSDKTLMRNTLAYGASRAIGRYAPRTRFVELFLNGDYRGVYVLIEQIELKNERVEGEALVEFTSDLQAQGKSESFRTPVLGEPIVWSDPKRDDLDAGEAAAIERLVGDAERALYTPARGDPGGDWRRFIDEDAAVEVTLLYELFKNQDAFETSTYMAERDDGKLHLGPIWDFNVGMGNSSFLPSRGVSGWIVARRDWAARLYQDPGFTRAFARRWRELRADGLLERLLATVDRHRELLRGEAARNFRRWPVLGEFVWPNPRDPRTGRVRQTYEQEVDHLRRWLRLRVRWIDANVGRLGDSRGGS